MFLQFEITQLGRTDYVAWLPFKSAVYVLLTVDGELKPSDLSPYNCSNTSNDSGGTLKTNMFYLSAC